MRASGRARSLISCLCLLRYPPWMRSPTRTQTRMLIPIRPPAQFPSLPTYPNSQKWNAWSPRCARRRTTWIYWWRMRAPRGARRWTRIPMRRWGRCWIWMLGVCLLLWGCTSLLSYCFCLFFFSFFFFSFFWLFCCILPGLFRSLSIRKNNPKKWLWLSSLFGNFRRKKICAITRRKRYAWGTIPRHCHRLPRRPCCRHTWRKRHIRLLCLQRSVLIPSSFFFPSPYSSPFLLFLFVFPSPPLPIPIHNQPNTNQNSGRNPLNP